MSIAFLLPTLPTVYPEIEAYAQEIEALSRRFGGSILHINPNRYLPRHFPVEIPRPFFGLHQLVSLARLGGRRSGFRLFQIYSPNLYPYPVLRLLRRPVVYTLTGGVDHEPDAAFFNSLAAVTVADDDSLAKLRSLGVKNANRVYCGIDTSKFTFHPVPTEGEIHLLMASAPWTRAQFRSKGVEALLEAARLEPLLKLTFLWRGILTREMQDRVKSAGLEDRVSVVDQPVDVNQVLSRVHATVALASRADIVKAFPHSLLDSVAAGKPVLVSRAIPMSSYVQVKGVGQVVEELTPQAVLDAAKTLMQGYPEAQKAALRWGKRDFDLDVMLRSHERVYRGIADLPQVGS